MTGGLCGCKGAIYFIVILFYFFNRLFSNELSLTPRARRSPVAQGLLEGCSAFALLHEVRFSSRRPERLLHPGITALVFPNFYHSDTLELLWLLAREGVRDGRTARAVALVRGKRLADGTWAQEKDLNTVATVGKKGQSNAFITERAQEVMGYYDRR